VACSTHHLPDRSAVTVYFISTTPSQVRSETGQRIYGRSHHLFRCVARALT
jgi:hypothetical protein